MTVMYGKASLELEIKGCVSCGSDYKLGESHGWKETGEAQIRLVTPLGCRDLYLMLSQCDNCINSGVVVTFPEFDLFCAHCKNELRECSCNVESKIESG